MHVPLVIRRPTHVAQPITLGVPFPVGAVSDLASLRLRDARGSAVPVQTTCLMHWPDGSAQWALLDFVLPAGCTLDQRWQLDLAAADTLPPTITPIVVQESSATWTIDTGTTVFTIDRRHLHGITQTTHAGRTLLAQDAAVRPRSEGDRPGLWLEDPRGRLHAARVVASAIESAGPLRVTLRLEAEFTDLDEHPTHLRAVLRVDCFAGLPLARLRLTLHNPRRALHRGGLWDLGDPGSVLFRDLSWTWQLADSGDTRCTWRAEPQDPPQSIDNGRVEIYQDSSGGENWHSLNHLNREGRVRSVFPGYRIRAVRLETVRRRAHPVAAVAGATGQWAIAVPEFWEQFPKALEADRGQLRVRLFPRQFGDQFELQGGEQKTHTVWCCTGATDEAVVDRLPWVYESAPIAVDCEWHAQSGAWRFLDPNARDPERRFEDYLVPVLDGPDGLLERRERTDEFGWRNYGDWFADHELQYYRGPDPLISHYNNQYDCILGGLLQWVRTGQDTWRELADALARHVVDIDIYHTREDRPAYNGGIFWHTDHYLSAATCTHRGYSRINRPPGQPYGGGPSPEQLATTGLVYYYLLTGDPLARDAVIELADWIVHMEDGSRSLLAVLDDGPTGSTSRTADADYHGPGRGPGHAINALLDAWQLTQRTHYREQAEALIRRCIHPADDIDQRQLLKTEKRWSYTVFLTVLDRYLHFKIQAQSLDEMYAYARASLLHYAHWMSEHEVPYFDRPQELIYPTEAWAVMEFRKANVLRLASAYCEEPARQKLWEAGHRFAERAWDDLRKFPTARSTRALAVMLQEGTRDLYFRVHRPPVAPRPDKAYDFGPAPPPFQPQRLRVLARFRRPWRLAAALNPVRWWTLFQRLSQTE